MSLGSSSSTYQGLFSQGYPGQCLGQGQSDNLSVLWIQLQQQFRDLRKSHFNWAPLSNDKSRQRHRELNQDQLSCPHIKTGPSRWPSSNSMIRKTESAASSLTCLIPYPQGKKSHGSGCRDAQNRCPILKWTPIPVLSKWETQPECTSLLFQLFEKLISNSYSFKSL